MLFSSLRVSGLVPAPERLREFVTKLLSPEADILEHVVAELPQFLPRTGAPLPRADSDDKPANRPQRRDLRRLGATQRPSRERHIPQCPQRPVLLRSPIKSADGCSGTVPAGRGAAFVRAMVEQG